MELRLFRTDGYRTINGGDDGSIVYHEYAHGLSNRLVTDAGGRGALNSPQAGAMGEGWSDWYAKDFLVGQFPAIDTGDAGDVDMGSTPTPRTRSAPGARLPGPARRGLPGGGQRRLGRLHLRRLRQDRGRPEVHADGEIWAQTLWDLRAAVGIPAARRLVTDGMRLSPREPTFLDMRNAILLADQAAGSADRTRSGRSSPGAAWATSNLGAAAGLLDAAWAGRSRAGRTRASSPTPRPSGRSPARRRRSARSPTGRTAWRAPAAPTARTASAACPPARIPTSSSARPAMTARCSR